MNGTDDDGKKVVCEWHDLLKKATSFDSWGQPVEAIDTYKRLSIILRKEATPDADFFIDEQKKVLNKIAACLEIRTKDLQSHNTESSVSFADVRKVEEKFIILLLRAKSNEFPVEIRGAGLITSRNSDADHWSESSSQASKFSEEQDEIASAEEIVGERTRGTLLPPPEPGIGNTLLAIRITKIALKDATQYLDPFITISVKDCHGVNLTALQDTPVATHKDDTAVYFGTDLFLQKPLEILPPEFAIFFEFKHYKPRKKMVSTRCWSFVEKDEIKEGAIVTELYKKPTDERRKKLHLLTVKPLYLHLKLTSVS